MADGTPISYQLLDVKHRLLCYQGTGVLQYKKQYRDHLGRIRWTPWESVPRVEATAQMMEEPSNGAR